MKQVRTLNYCFLGAFSYLALASYARAAESCSAGSATDSAVLEGYSFSNSDGSMSVGTLKSYGVFDLSLDTFGQPGVITAFTGLDQSQICSTAQLFGVQGAAACAANATPSLSLSGSNFNWGTINAPTILTLTVTLTGAGSNAASLSFVGDTAAFQITSINGHSYNQPTSAGSVALALDSDVTSTALIAFKPNWIDNSTKTMTATLTDSQGSAQTITFMATYIHPMQVTSALAWYRADAITDLMNSDPVSLWDNSIASAPAVIQPDLNLQPTYLSDGINHLPSVYFYGDTLSASTITTPGSSARTLVVVGQVTEPFAGNMLRGFAYTGSGAGAFELFNNYSSAIGYYVGSEGQDSVATSVLQPSVYVMDYDGNDLHLYRNGSLLLTKTSFTLNTSLAGLTLGDNLIGTISELGLFSAALSTADRQAVQCYLSAKYALGISCP